MADGGGPKAASEPSGSGASIQAGSNSRDPDMRSTNGLEVSLLKTCAVEEYLALLLHVGLRPLLVRTLVCRLRYRTTSCPNLFRRRVLRLPRIIKVLNIPYSSHRFRLFHHWPALVSRLW